MVTVCLVIAYLPLALALCMSCTLSTCSFAVVAGLVSSTAVDSPVGSTAFVPAVLVVQVVRAAGTELSALIAGVVPFVLAVGMVLFVLVAGMVLFVLVAGMVLFVLVAGMVLAVLPGSIAVVVCCGTAVAVQLAGIAGC